MPNLCQTADYMCKKGIHIFPVLPDLKVVTKGFSWSKECTKNEKKVSKWWRAHPQSNIGVATGPSGLVVIDIDVKNGKTGLDSLRKMQKKYGFLPKTFEVKTPSGGKHLYFKGKTRSAADVLGYYGVDVRSVGGYVLGPNSSLKKTDKQMEGEYTANLKDIKKIAELPEKYIKLFGQALKREQKRYEGSELGLDTDQEVRRAAVYLQEAKPAIEGQGGDDTTFQTAAALHEFAISEPKAVELMLEHYNPRCSPPWDVVDMEKKVRNGYEFGKNETGSKSPTLDFDDDPPVPKPITSPGRPLQDWILITAPRVFLHRETRQTLGPASMEVEYGHIVQKGKLWDKICKTQQRLIEKKRSMCYRPGKGEIVKGEFNLWRNTTIPPKKGKVDWFEDHILFLANGNKEHQQLMLNWMAWVLQYPDKKTAYALLIQGPHGCGKSWVGAVLSAIIGSENVVEPSNEEIHGQFNSWCRGKQLAIIHELMAKGRLDLVNKLKPLITDATIRVEEKYTPVYSIENKMNFVMFTNHEDAIPIEKGERRYFIIMTRKKRPQAYMSELWKKIKDPKNIAAVCHFLMNRDLSGYDALVDAPETEDKEIVRRASLSDVTRLLWDCYEQRAYPFNGDVVSMNQIKSFVMSSKERKPPRLQHEIEKFLKVEIEAFKMGQRYVSENRQTVLWAVRNAEDISNLTHVQQVRFFNEGLSLTEEEHEEDSDDSFIDL